MCKKKRLNVKVLGCNTVFCNLSGLLLTGPVRSSQATHVTQSRAVVIEVFAACSDELSCL